MNSAALRRLAQTPAARPAPLSPERCDLCAEPLPPEHRHLLDLATGQPQCACRACAILFDRGAAGGDHYRLIPERRLRLDDLRFEERWWPALGIPVDLVFLTTSTASGGPVARYPSPVGMTTHVPAADAWEEVVAANPVIAGMEPDVEALLLHRGRERWLLGVDDCFRLAARLREHWSGFTGGDAVWEEIARFFAELHAEHDPEEAAWR